MTSSTQNQASTAEQPPLPAVMNSLLLAPACAGSWQDLESLVDGETGQASSSATIQRASDDEEACLRASSLLEGVTVEGDTALHVVASSDDGDKFLRSADIIFRKAKDLLFLQNNKGDTPLHCAAQAGNSRMVSRLTGFAKAEHRGKELLETENKLGETALHEAVSAGSSSMINQLMEEDPELASLPRGGASPLYLAVLFGDKIIAETLLHAKSAAGELSYSGPNGQNALHAGLLRDKLRCCASPSSSLLKILYQILK